MDLINGMIYNVTCKNKSASIFAEPTVTYTGEVVKSAPYDPPESIRMTTGNITVPFRVIMRNNIISINDRTFCYQQVAVNDEVKVVKGSNGNEYIVKTSNGVKTCSCPGFTFRKSCKHIL